MLEEVLSTDSSRLRVQVRLSDESWTQGILVYPEAELVSLSEVICRSEVVHVHGPIAIVSVRNRPSNRGVGGIYSDGIVLGSGSG